MVPMSQCLACMKASVVTTFGTDGRRIIRLSVLILSA